MSASLPAATRARHVVLFFAISLAVITYVDRVCISQAAPMLQRDLGLTKIQMGYAFTAFGWAYALFEIPGGWLGEDIDFLYDYIASGEPMDKAGAYAVQGRAAAFISRIEGSYSGIMGLPLAETVELLAAFDIESV